jgi:signal transduction histidine kinase
MPEFSLPLICFPQLFPRLGVESDSLVIRGLTAVRVVFSFAMALYLLAVIFPGSQFSLVPKLSTYAYVVFATVVSYQSRSAARRRTAAMIHLIGFTLFTCGNAAYALLASHQILRAMFWMAWLPGIYVDRTAVYCRNGKVLHLLMFSASLVAIVLGCVLWLVLVRPFPVELLLIIPIAHVASISTLNLVASAKHFLSDPHSSHRVRQARELAERKLTTERAATQLQLEHINRSLTMGALAASIAHEISQPVAAVVTNASAASNWLHDDHLDLEEARKAIGRVVEGGHRVSAVITSFRAMLSGDLPERSPVRLHELVTEALSIRAPEIQGGAVTVLTPALEAIPGVVGDGVQLRQVFLNLITNAIDALHEVIDKPRLLIIHCEEDDNACATVSVEDNGPGLKTEDPAIIFEPFFSTKSHGMGMGLFICRMIVETHGGSLKVHSRPGRTRFRVSIPTKYAYA